MAKEKGVVIKANAETAWVKTRRTDGCATCSQKQACHISENGRDMEVEAINAVNAKVGDWVVLTLPTSSLLKGAFLLYVFPVLSMLLGAVIGQETAPFFDLGSSGFSAVLGMAFFFAAFFIIRISGNRMARRTDYRPRIIKIER